MSLKALIIEPSPTQVNHLRQLLHPYRHGLEIVAILSDLPQAQSWLAKHAQPDILFLEPNLGEEQVIDYFRKEYPLLPTIITTAHNDRSREAHEVLCLGYLNKPIKPKKFRQAMDRFIHLSPSLGLKASTAESHAYKQRFLVQSGPNLFPVPVSEVACIYTEQEKVFLMTRQGKDFPLNSTLEELENRLHPHFFFRANRSTLLHIGAVATVQPYFNRRLVINLVPPAEREVLVPKEKAVSFKRWLDL